MLGKLIKHEFRATARDVLGLYIIVLVITVVLKGMLEIQNIFHVDNEIMSMLTALTIFAFVLGIISVILGSFILMIKRFYDNMLKDEGYLSFTLPVSVGQHIASKSIISYVWMILSFVFVGLMLVILGLGDNELIGAVKDVFSEAVKMIQETNSMKYVVEVIVMLLLTGYVYISMGYACFSIGQTFGKNKVLGAFVSYLVLYFIGQIVSSIFMVILFGSNMDALNNAEMTKNFFQPLMIFSIVFAVIECIVFNIITHVMLSKKLNLQ